MKIIINAILLVVFLFSDAASAQVLKIGDFSINANGETEIIKLNERGQLTVNNQQIGELKAVGNLIDRDGKIIAAIDKQGKVTDSDKKLIGVIGKNGEIDFGSGKKRVWTKDGKFFMSEKDFMTISPNRKKFYKTASFLILLNYLIQDKSESTAEISQFGNKDNDVIASYVTSSGGRYISDYSLTVYGDGRIEYTGFNSFGNAKKIRTTKAKINLLLQKADELTFKKPESSAPAAPVPFVHDALSYSMSIWYKGDLKKVAWSTGEKLPQEIYDFISFFNKLFEPEIKETGN